MHEWNVSELVLHARLGDVDAFTDLVRRYQAMAFGYAYSQLGDFHLAEDVAQQAFIAAYNSLPKLKDPERFGGWLRGIVHYECFRLWRARSVVQVPITQADQIVGDTDPSQRIEGREGLERVFSAINSLPQTEREVTVLYYVHDHSQREVAAFLDVPVTTVNNRLRTARTALKKELVLTMANDAFNEYRLPESFASRIGEIVRTHGPLVDARFDPQQRPRVLNALTVTDETSNPLVTVEAIQYLNDNLVRCVALTQDTSGIDTGMRVIDTGGPIRVPLERASIENIISSIGSPPSTLEVMETGIKVIDLLSPLPQRGRIALIGDMQTGKMVFVEELIRRLADTTHDLSIFVFVETPDEVTVINELEYRSSASVGAIYLPVADTSPAALGALTAGLDAVVAFSRTLAGQHLYPAIDPVRSSSRLLARDVLGHEHVQSAIRVRELLQEGNGNGNGNSPVAGRMRNFLTQPLFVAEEFTQRHGEYVSIGDTIHGCNVLLDEDHNTCAPEDLYMRGALAEEFDNSAH